MHITTKVGIEWRTFDDILQQQIMEGGEQKKREGECKTDTPVQYYFYLLGRSTNK